MRKTFKKTNIQVSKLLKENNLQSIPRVILSSAVVVLFFYSLPLIISFANNKMIDNDGYQNNSKAILAYTLNNQSKRFVHSNVYIFSNSFF